MKILKKTSFKNIFLNNQQISKGLIQNKFSFQNNVYRKKVDSFKRETNNFSYEFTNHVKFPTFEFPGIEKEFENEPNYKTIVEDLKICQDKLNEFCDNYDKLFIDHSQSKFVKDTLSDSKLNHISYKLFALILKRHVMIIKSLVEQIINSSKTSNIEEELKENLHIDTNHDEMIHQLLEMNRKYFSDNDDAKSKFLIKELIENHIKSEKNLLEFTHDHPNFSPSLYTLNITVKVLKVLLNEIDKYLSQLLDFTIVDSKFEEKLIHFFHSCSKLEAFSNIFIFSYKAHSAEIFNQPADSQIWKDLSNHIERKEVLSKEEIKKKLEKIFTTMILSQAAVSKGYSRFKGKFTKVFGTAWYFAYFGYYTKKAKIQAMRFMINPTLELAQLIWGLADAKGIRTLIQLSLPKVKYSKYWYLRKTEEEINPEKIKLLIEKAYSDVPLECSTKLNAEKTKKYSPDDLISPQEQVKNINDYVRVKIINHKKLKVPEKNKDYKSAIIHIHGGGFIALSPSSHENYTRKWTNKLEVPVFSIDYRLAPEYPYPNALDDIYQAYMWVINYAEEVLGIDPENLVLVGDSAGGNLVASLTYLLILLNKRLPNGIFLAYPGLAINLNQVSGSSLNAINDVIIPYPFLKFCVQAYMSDYTNVSDPFLSPLLMSDKVLRCLPPVRILVGSSDPLRDDCVLYTNKLIGLKKDVKMIEFKYFPHGFLSFDSPQMMPEASVTNDIIMEEFSKFLK